MQDMEGGLAGTVRRVHGRLDEGDVGASEDGSEREGETSRSWREARPSGELFDEGGHVRSVLSRRTVTCRSRFQPSVWMGSRVWQVGSRDLALDKVATRY